MLKIVRVGRWSVRGGDIVPAVVGVVMSVVKVTSRRVAVLWTGSCRVGVVISLWRLL